MTRISCGEIRNSFELNLEIMITNAKELTKYRQKHKKSLISRVKCIRSMLLTFSSPFDLDSCFARHQISLSPRFAWHHTSWYSDKVYQHVLVILSQDLLYVLQMKCLKYWPDTELEIGPFILTLDTEDVYDQYTLRYLIVQHQVRGSLIKFFQKFILQEQEYSQRSSESVIKQ